MTKRESLEGNLRPSATLVSLFLIAFTGCASQQPARSTSAPPVPSNVTTINGQVPPEKVVPLQDQVKMLQTSDGRGNTILFVRAKRLAHTRAPIHMHAHGGTTCVLEGQMTLYMEGMSPTTAKAGTCYFMPPGHVMTGVNDGATDTILIDSFTYPEGTAPWTPVEPNTESSARQFDL